MPSVSEILSEANIRFERIIWIENELANFSSPSELFCEFVEDLPENQSHPLYYGLPSLAVFADADEHPDAEEVTAVLFFGNVRGGYIVQVARPVMTRISESARSFSWGHYRTCWLYAPDLGAMVSAAVAWASEQEAAENSTPPAQAEV